MAPRVPATREQEHELGRHDVRHAAGVEREPCSGLRYVCQQTCTRGRSVAEIDVGTILEIAPPLLAFFSCHARSSSLGFAGVVPGRIFNSFQRGTDTLILRPSC